VDADEFKGFTGRIPSLTASQRKVVFAHLKELGTAAPAAKAERAADELREDWLASGIAYAAHSRGLISKPDPYLMTFLVSAFAAFRKKAPEARALLLSGFPSPPAKAQRDMLGRLAADALFFFAGRLSGPPLAAVLYNIHQVGEAMERSFPGYVTAKLLPVLTSSRSHNA
jgi:hypothetical protein